MRLPAAFALWIAERTGGPVRRFEWVAPGDEQILEDREQNTAQLAIRPPSPRRPTCNLIASPRISAVE